MSEPSSVEFLRRAAQRAAERPFFVASDLAAYQELHQMGEEALAEFLGCQPEQLPRLALCRRPDPAGSAFRREVERIAAHVGARPERLAQLVREVEAVHALRRAGPQHDRRNDQGMLLAARDRTGEEAPEAGTAGAQEASGAPSEKGADSEAGDKPQAQQ